MKFSKVILCASQSLRILSYVYSLSYKKLGSYYQLYFIIFKTFFACYQIAEILYTIEDYNIAYHVPRLLVTYQSMPCDISPLKDHSKS